MAETPGALQYPDLARIRLGGWAKHLVNWMLLISIFGTLIAYVIAINGFA